MSDAVANQIKPDYEQAKSLYLTGLSIRDIASQLNVSFEALRRKAVRGKWTQVKRDAVAMVQSVTEQGRESLTQSQSNRVKSRIGGVVEADLAVIEQSEPTTLAQVERRQAVLGQLTSTAKTVFGWSDESKAGTINIALLQQACESYKPVPIDVESTKVEPNQT